jgi:hypothetical protein
MRTRLRLATFFALPCLLLWASNASAAVFNYVVHMDGPSESPANASPGIGDGTVSYNDATHLLTLNATFSGLTGTTTASHIHAPTPAPFTLTAGVATTTPSFAGFPLGVASGSYSNVLDLTLASSYNPAFVSANGGTTASAEIALTNAFKIGEAYWNIHSSTFGGGEIRGFLIAVPEPATCGLFVLGAMVLGACGRRRS